MATRLRPVAPHVPFVDLGRSHRQLRDALLADFGELIDTGAFSNGPAVAAFEEEYAHFCHATRAVGVGSGLDALRLSLLALGVGPGDEVIAPANTFIATIEAISQAGARPVLVDASMADYNMDVAGFATAVTPRTRAVVPVHLYGQLANMLAIDAIASPHGMAVVEDACQAHGATRDFVRPGSHAHAAAFSFYPGKNLGAMGDAGAVVTNDDALADHIVALREHGQTAKSHHQYIGYTSRLDTMQALVLRRKLSYLEGWNVNRQAAAALYSEALAGVGDLVLPPVAERSEPVWHLYVVLTEEPVAFAAFLRERGIATGRHYPQPPHLSPAYAWLGHRTGSFPVTERLATHGVSLPMFGGITDGEVEAVVDAVHAYFARA